jgi:sugar phosphate permease
VGRPRYRWAVLAAGTAAQAAYIGFVFGLPILAPALQDELNLSLTQVGVVIAAPWVGAAATLLPWGFLADRLGERIVLAGGIGLCGVLLLLAAATTSYLVLLLVLAAAGAAGASVNSASGRAVMSWFGREERGLALGIRQSSSPLGGILAAVALPPVERAGGVDAAFVFLAALLLAGALAGGYVVRDVPAESGVDETPAVLRNPTLWLLGASGALYLVAQVAVTGFLVLFLHEERGFSTQEAAAVLGASQAVAIAVRIAAGRWSDVADNRLGPLRVMGLAASVSLVVTAALVDAPTWSLVGAFVVAGAVSMAWNGLSFAAAAELVGRARSGAAIGFQQTALVVSGAVAAPLFAALVDAVSWRAGFAAAAAAPLIGCALLVGLREGESRDAVPRSAFPRQSPE